jgi:hypothetical protein
MRILRLLITRGVVLPGGVNASPGETHEIEERFARSLLYDGRAVPATDVLTPDSSEEIEDLLEIQDRDPQPTTRDPRRKGPQ